MTLIVGGGGGVIGRFFFFFGGFKKYTPIKVDIVVNAMIKLASGNNSEQTYLSDRLQELGSN